MLLSDETVMCSRAEPDGLLNVIGVPAPSLKFTYPFTLLPVDRNFCAKLCGLDRILGDGDIIGFCCDIIDPGSDIFKLNCLLPLSRVS